MIVVFRKWIKCVLLDLRPVLIFLFFLLQSITKKKRVEQSWSFEHTFVKIYVWPAEQTEKNPLVNLSHFPNQQYTSKWSLIIPARMINFSPVQLGDPTPKNSTLRKWPEGFFHISTWRPHFNMQKIMAKLCQLPIPTPFFYQRRFEQKKRQKKFWCNRREQALLYLQRSIFTMRCQLTWQWWLTSAIPLYALGAEALGAEEKIMERWSLFRKNR